MVKKEQEIEIKLALQDSQKKKLINWLQENALLVRQIEQEDYYFQPTSKNFFEYNDSSKNYTASTILRIRRENNNAQLCYKQWHYDDNTALYADEYEVSFSHDSFKAMQSILTALGYEPVVAVKKARCVYHYKDIEIACDSVEELGEFVEFEVASQMENPEEGRAMLYSLLQEIGITEYDEVARGYSSLLLGKRRCK